MQKKSLLLAIIISILTTGCTPKPIQPYKAGESFVVKVNVMQTQGVIGNWTDDDFTINNTRYSISAWKSTTLNVVTHTNELTFTRGPNKQKMHVKKGDIVDVLIGDFNFNVVKK